MEVSQGFPPLKTFQHLQRQEFQPLEFIVPELLPEGLTLFAGSSKQGKSRLVLDTALAVATGGHAFSNVPVKRRGVILLSLEDNERRLQGRTEELGGCFPDNLYYHTDWPLLDRGGLENLEQALEQAPDVGFVIIDTYGRVAPQSKTGANPYLEDVKALKGLHQLALARRVGILLVHHNRKREADDPFDMMSGTTGLTSVPDALWSLQKARCEHDATLTVTGRDIEERRLALRYEPEAYRWHILGDASVFSSSDSRSELLALLAQADAPLSTSEIAQHLGRTRQSVDQMLKRCRDAGEVARNTASRWSLLISLKGL